MTTRADLFENTARGLICAKVLEVYPAQCVKINGILAY